MCKMETQQGCARMAMPSSVDKKPTVVHSRLELECGINSIETVPTYRSNANSGNTTGRGEEHSSSDHLDREHCMFISLPRYEKNTCSVAVEPNIWKVDSSKPGSDGSKTTNSSKATVSGIYGARDANVIDGVNVLGGKLHPTVVSQSEKGPWKMGTRVNDVNRGVSQFVSSNMDATTVFTKPSADSNVDPSLRQSHNMGQVFRANKHDNLGFKSSRKDPRLLPPSATPSCSNMVCLSAPPRPAFFWHRPFAKKSSGSSHFMGASLVETVNPSAQKSWHLEAISALTREQYASLKMVMLRLSKGQSNLEPASLLMLSRYQWEVLQEGTFGTVYVGFVEKMGNCAVKIPVSCMLRQDPVGVMRRYINEWDILSRCDHPNIVKLYGGLIFGVFDIWLCTELIGGADLHSIKYDHVKKRNIPRGAGLKMCRQLADAIRYLHTPTADRGEVVHRDIKPENIIVMPNWDIKLCDFGDAYECNREQADNISGATWLYAPPELLTHKSIIVDILEMESYDEEKQQKLSEKWDIWSMGCVFQEMFGYSGPFHHLVDLSDSSSVICEKMVAKAFEGLVPCIPRVLARTRMGQLISQCLSNDPDARPTAEQICAILSAPDSVLLS